MRGWLASLQVFLVVSTVLLMAATITDWYIMILAIS